jgi:hypothetical protein
VKNVKKKVLVIITVAMLALALLITSIVAVSQAQQSNKSDPKYVIYDFQITLNVSAAVVTYQKSSGFIWIQDDYMPPSGIITANVTINGVVYTWPKDFDYGSTEHWEFNLSSGYGLYMVQETLTFKPSVIGTMLEEPSTLIGLAEEKVTGLIYVPKEDVSHLEILGNFQLTGTGRLSNVQGYGTGMIGNSTNYVVRHFAYISGWPL